MLSGKEEIEKHAEKEIIAEAGQSYRITVSTMMAGRGVDMAQDIKNDLVSTLKTCTITAEGIDLAAEGFSGASTTWTYMIDESTSQFSRLPQMIKSMSTMAGESLLSLGKIYAKVKRKFNKNKQ